jgi:hypothetical protein
MIAIAVLHHLLLVIWGYSLLRCLWPRLNHHLWLVVPLSYFLGQSMVILWMYLCAIFAAPFSLLIIDVPISIAALLAFYFSISVKPELGRPVLTVSASGKQQPLKVLLTLVFAAYIFWQIAYVLWMVWHTTFYEWDVVWRIGLKGKVFFLDQGVTQINNLPYSEYALGGPFLMSHIANHAGMWDEQLVKSLSAAEFLMFSIFFIGFLKLYIPFILALLGTALMVSANFYTYQATLLFNDFPVSIFFCSSIFCLVLANTLKDERLVLVAALLLSTACLFKLESFLYIFLILITWKWIFPDLRSHLKKIALLFGLPLAMTGLCHVAFCFIKKVQWAGVSFSFLTFDGILARAQAAVLILGQQLFMSWNWNILWGALAMLMVTHMSSFLAKKETKPLGALLILFVCYLVCISTFTSRYVFLSGSYAHFTLPRMVLHFFPLCPALIAFLISSEIRKDFHHRS